MKKIITILSLVFVTSTVLAGQNIFEATEKRMITRKNSTIHGTCTAAGEAAAVKALASCYKAGFETCEEIDGLVISSPNGIDTNKDHCIVKSTVQGS